MHLHLCLNPNPPADSGYALCICIPQIEYVIGTCQSIPVSAVDTVAVLASGEACAKPEWLCFWGVLESGMKSR